MNNIEKIKVLIVDDSPTQVQYLKHIFNATGRLEVIGTAGNGQEALDFVRHTRPDIITMDINMPVMDGFEATREIMQTDPIPIVILSASWDPSEVKKSFQAVEAGALATFSKPQGLESADSEQAIRELVTGIESLAGVKLVTRQRTPRRKSVLRGVASLPTQHLRHARVVAIGVSTGGPPVLRDILSGLSRDYPFPILIVQHISHGFTEGLVEWLKETSGVELEIARQGVQLLAGRAYMAPDDHHMEVDENESIFLTDEEPVGLLRPAVSRLFRSVCEVYGEKTIAVLLTGMGNDGAEEMKDIRDAGGTTIVQDQQSSVVHGMPGAAIKLGAAMHILSPGEIVKMLNRLAGKGS